MKETLKTLKNYRFTHRGFYDNRQIPENSMPAFLQTRAHGFGTELDVHLLKDGTLAVLHDSDLKRMTGREGRIEDLRREDLQHCRLLDTEERIPLFSEVLALELPLIVELKVSGGNCRRLCEAAWEQLKDYSAPWCVESFDPRAVLWFARNHPEAVRGQLSQNYSKTPEVAIPGILRFVLSNLLLNFLTGPDFIAYRYEDRDNRALKRCLRRGMQEVSWTIRSKAELLSAEAAGSIPIFEKFNPEED